MNEGVPVSVTLIKPSSVDTRFFDHTKSQMGGLGKAPGPQFAAEVVANAILYAAEHSVRHFPVGSSAVFGPTVRRLAPGVAGQVGSSYRLQALVGVGDP